MGICSFFGLRRSLSPLSFLAEVVKIDELGKKGKPAERWLGSLRRSCGSMPQSAGSGAVEILGFDSVTGLNQRVK
jgi:hypothetical protein